MNKKIIAAVTTASCLIGTPMTAMADEITTPSVDDVNRQLDSSAKAVSAAQSAVDAVNEHEQDVALKQSVVNEAKESLDSAESNLNQAKDAYQASQENVANATKAEANAQAVMNSAKVDMDAANQQVNDRQQALDSFDADAASKELEEAKASLDTAQEALSQASKEHDDALAQANAKQEALNKADAAETASKQAYDDASKKVDDLQALKDAGSKEAALQRLQEAEKKQQELQTKRDTAAKAESVAVNALSAAVKNNDSAKSSLKLAQSAATAKEAAAKNAEAQLKLGTLGWFQSRGSTQAVKILTDPKTTMYVDAIKIGDPEDATSLENMKASLAYIRQCNELRAKHGLPPLKIDDTRMAQAEANADWSRNHASHSGQFTSGENLSWNYDKDPFKGWYYEEKAEFDSGNHKFNDTGHYQNIVDPMYKTTGFAIAQGGSAFPGASTYTQEFYWQNISSAQTVDEYEKQFNAYYNPLKSASDDYKKALEKVEAAQSSVDKTSSLLKQVQDEASRATSYREQVDAQLKQAQDEVAKAKAAYDAIANAPGQVRLKSNVSIDDALVKAKQEKENKFQEWQSAKKSHAVALDEFNSAQSLVEKRVQALNDARADLDTAQKNYDEKLSGSSTDALEKALAESKAAYNACVAKYHEAVEAHNASVEKLARENAGLDAAKQSLDDAQKVYDDAKSRYDSASSDLDKAKANLDAAKSLLNAIKSKEEAAKNAEAEANKRLDTILDDADGHDAYRVVPVNAKKDSSSSDEDASTKARNVSESESTVDGSNSASDDGLAATGANSIIMWAMSVIALLTGTSLIGLKSRFGSRVTGRVDDGQ